MDVRTGVWLDGGGLSSAVVRWPAGYFVPARAHTGMCVCVSVCVVAPFVAHSGGHRVFLLFPALLWFGLDRSVLGSVGNVSHLKE